MAIYFLFFLKKPTYVNFQKLSETFGFGFGFDFDFDFDSFRFVSSIFLRNSKKQSGVEVIFGPKSTSKTRFDSFTPSPRIVEKK